MQVTLAMCLVGAMGYLRGALVMVSQILGAMAAAAVIDALLPGPLLVRTLLSGGTSIVRGLFLEMFLTAQLVFTILMLAAERHQGTFIAPVGVGLSLFIAELVGVYYTGGSLNPARSFGPDVVVTNFEGYHWIYWVGPFLGSLVAAGFYLFIKALEYETLHPARHADGTDNDGYDPPRKSESANNMDENKRAGDPNRGGASGMVNGSRAHHVDGVHQLTTNEPARNDGYAGGPGMEAGPRP
jgi:aquaporin rerated protein, other eukaryote